MKRVLCDSILGHFDLIWGMYEEAMIDIQDENWSDGDTRLPDLYEIFSGIPGMTLVRIMPILFSTFYGGRDERI